MTNNFKSNFELVQFLKNCLLYLQVEELVICAGARNAPLVHYLNEDRKFTVYSFFEERSAAFFALGRIKDKNKPVAVIMTSGTAVGEALPAVIESFYQQIPLIIISADRPKNYRGTGSPQSIIQNDIFKNYVGCSFDWDIEFEFSKIQFKKNIPIHFNICFDEPLLDKSKVTHLENKNRNFIENIDWIYDNFPDNLDLNFYWKQPLVIVSGIPEKQQNDVLQFLKYNQFYYPA